MGTARLIASALLVLGTCAIFRVVAQLPDAREPAWFSRMIQSKAASAQQYTFDASIALSRKIGEMPRETVAAFTAKLAVAPGNKLLFWLGDKDTLEYIIVSDGQRTWVYVPSGNQYMEFEAIATGQPAHPDAAFLTGLPDASVDPLTMSRLVVPVLATLDYHEAAVVNMKWPSDASSEAEHRALPVLTILSGASNVGVQKMADITIDPETLAIAQLNWSKSIRSGDEPNLAFLDVTFSRLQLGDPLPPSFFVFDPGGAVKKESLPIAGLESDRIIGKAVQQFEVTTSAGKKISLSDLRGHTVLISFSAPDCVACEKESAALSAIRQQYGSRGLTVIEAGRENAPLKGLIQLRFFPTLILINKDGMIVRYSPGAHNVNQLRAMLQASGI